jgi:hypothetical protein
MRPGHGAGAQYLGIDRVFSGERIWLAGRWCYAADIGGPWRRTDCPGAQ